MNTSTAFWSIAIEKGRVELVKIMLDAGADVNLATLEQITPLIAAAYAGNPQIVEMLLAKRPRLEEQDRMHKSALVYAAGMGHRQVVAQLLAAGATIDAAYVDGLTPLMWAAGQGHPQTVKLLLDSGANPTLKDERGLTALDIARQNQQQAVVDLLNAPR